MCAEAEECLVAEAEEEIEVEVVGPLTPQLHGSLGEDEKVLVLAV